MKATLSFNLDEEREEFNLALRAGDLQSALESFDGWLRSKVKYEEHPDTEEAVYRACRERLHEILEQYEVSLND